MLLDQFSGGVRTFTHRLKRLNQLKVTSEDMHEIRSATKSLHHSLNELGEIVDKLRKHASQEEMLGIDKRFSEKEDIAQKMNESVAEVLKNLTLERFTDNGSSKTGGSTKNGGVGGRSTISRHSNASRIEEERVNKLSEAAAIRAELVFEEKERELQFQLDKLQKEKRIASLEAQVQASRKAKALEIHGSIDCDVFQIPEESAPERELRIIKSIGGSAEGESAKATLGVANPGALSVNIPTPRLGGNEVECYHGQGVDNKPQQKLAVAPPSVVNDTRLSYRIPDVKLDTFNGNVVQFPAWEMAFDALIGDRVTCVKHKMNLLGQYLIGEPKQLISGLMLRQSEEAYDMARQRLKSRYGNPSVTGQAFMDKLGSWPKVGNNQPSDLQRLSDFLVQVMEVKKSINGLQILDFAPESTRIVQKLPVYLQHKWRERVLVWKQHNNGAYPPFEELVRLVDRCSEEANVPELRSLAHKDFKPSRTLATSVREKRETPGSDSSCAFCAENHHIDVCEKIMDISREDRLRFLREKGRCFGCGGSDHFSRNCNDRVACRKCHQRHLAFLHVDKEETEPNTESAHSFCTDVNGVSGCDCSMIVPVWVRSSNTPSHEVLSYCILDGQSNTCFISEDLQRELGIVGKQTNLTLSTVYKSNAVVSSTRIDGLEVMSYDKRKRISLPSVFTRESIPASRSQIPTPEGASQWKHLSSIEHQITPYQSGVGVGILIGNNVPSAIRPREIIAGKEEEPYAQRSILGWGLVGMVCGNLTNHEGQAVTHRINASSFGVALHLASNGKWMECSDKNDQMMAQYIFATRTKEVIDPVSVRKIMEVDFVESTSKAKELSVEDQRFIKMLSDNIYQQENGHYVMPLSPNHLLTLKPKLLLPPPGRFQRLDLYVRQRWRRVQHLSNEFWLKWRKQLLHQLQHRQKWVTRKRNLQVGDVVILAEEDTPRNSWKLARVEIVYPGPDELVRKVQLRLADTNMNCKGERTKPASYIDRPIHKLVLLHPAPEDESNNNMKIVN